MRSTVVPFPSYRRLGHIRRTATAMAKADRKWAEGHLREQIRRLGESLRRRGVPEDAVKAETAAYEVAVRAALGHLGLTCGGTR
jgi:L-rhamnose isomerase